MAQDTDARDTDIRVDLLLDEATREARLWDRARGRMSRWTYDDAGHLLAVAMFVGLFLWSSTRESVSSTVLLLVLTFAVTASWQSFRLSRRIDALARLLEKQKGRV